MKTGNTSLSPANRIRLAGPQWSPVMKTGNTSTEVRRYPAP